MKPESFRNPEFMEKVSLLFLGSFKISTKRVRCFRNYLRLMDKCKSLENSRVEYGIHSRDFFMVPEEVLAGARTAEVGSKENWNHTLLTEKEFLLARLLLQKVFNSRGFEITPIRKFLDSKVHVKSLGISVGRCNQCMLGSCKCINYSILK